MDNLVVCCVRCNITKGGDVHVAMEWVAFPPRFFDAQVTQVVSFYARHYRWSQTRREQTLAIVEGRRVLNEDNVGSLRGCADRDGSDWSKSPSDPKRKLAALHGPPAPRRAPGPDLVLESHEHAAAQRLARFQHQAPRAPKPGKTWGDEHLIADPSTGVVVAGMTWENSTGRVREAVPPTVEQLAEWRKNRREIWQDAAQSEAQ